MNYNKPKLTIAACFCIFAVREVGNGVAKCLEVHEWEFLHCQLILVGKNGFRGMEIATTMNQNTQFLPVWMHSQTGQGGNGIAKCLGSSVEGSSVASKYCKWKMKCVEKWTGDRGIQSTMKWKSLLFCAFSYYMATERGNDMQSVSRLRGEVSLLLSWHYNCKINVLRNGQG